MRFVILKAKGCIHCDITIFFKIGSGFDSTPQLRNINNAEGVKTILKTTRASPVVQSDCFFTQHSQL